MKYLHNILYTSLTGKTEGAYQQHHVYFMRSPMPVSVNTLTHCLEMNAHFHKPFGVWLQMVMQSLEKAVYSEKRGGGGCLHFLSTLSASGPAVQALSQALSPAYRASLEEERGFGDICDSGECPLARLVVWVEAVGGRRSRAPGEEQREVDE